jgi:hypothetical protein
MNVLMRLPSPARRQILCRSFPGESRTARLARGDCSCQRGRPRLGRIGSTGLLGPDLRACQVNPTGDSGFTAVRNRLIEKERVAAQFSRVCSYPRPMPVTPAAPAPGAAPPLSR